jgi:FixJ family two-component response regulator
MNDGRSAKVFVVDDDEFVCVALSRLIRTGGFHVETFGTAAECLCADRLKDADCLVLDVHLPDLSGLELQVPPLGKRGIPPIRRKRRVTGNAPQKRIRVRAR